MCDIDREQHPLLEDISDEEFRLPYHHRRTIRSRARGKIKGAAVIINRWPDYLSSLTCWSLALFGMIVFFMFIMYNSAESFVYVPPTISRSINYHEDIYQTLVPEQPDVYIHYFVDESDNLDLNREVIHFRNLTNKYPKFSYHIIIVRNDTKLKINILDSAEEMNEQAMNTILNKDTQIPKKVIMNISIEEVSLSSFLEQSIMKERWQNLSPTYFPFLVRAMCVWAKGGIAFDPVIVKNKSLSRRYITKLYEVFDNYGKEKEVKKDHHIKTVGLKKTKKKLNNIQDIIEALENNESVYNNVQHNLSEAESFLHTRTKRFIPDLTKAYNVKNNNSKDDYTFSSNMFDFFVEKHSYDIVNASQTKLNSKSQHTNDTVVHNSNKVLPLFLEILFHNKNKDTTQNKTTVTRQRKSPVDMNITKRHTTTEEIKDLILLSMPPTEMYDVHKHHNTVEHVHSLTIDIKGLIIASDTPCHAFIGNLFTDLMHFNSDYSILDFIFRELSIFCKGLLSSCYGINVIMI